MLSLAQIPIVAAVAVAVAAAVVAVAAATAVVVAAVAAAAVVVVQIFVEHRTHDLQLRLPNSPDIFHKNNFCSRRQYNSWCPYETIYEKIQRGYLRPKANTICCDQMPQHFKSPNRMNLVMFITIYP